MLLSETLHEQYKGAKTKYAKEHIMTFICIAKLKCKHEIFTQFKHVHISAK